MGGNMKNKSWVTAVYVVVLVIASIVTIYPLLYTISIAFSPGEEYNIGVVPFTQKVTETSFNENGKLQMRVATKFGFSTRHFQELFEYDGYLDWIKNTFIVAIGVVLITICVCTLTAYVFSRFKFPMKKGMMLTILILQIFPTFIGMQAVYEIVVRVGGYNHLWALVLIYGSGNVPYNTWLIKSYLDTIPMSLDEAARIDGANHFKIFGTIIMPMLKPMIVFLGITSFTGPWVDFIYPKLILKPDNTTLGPGLLQLLGTGSTESHFTLFAAGALLVAVPFILVFIFGQSAMVTGLGAGAVKE